ncbi:MAG: hemin receptor [Acidobacteria bacterium]|nr:hemin receptor [Acidobacteriota bacterium]
MTDKQINLVKASFERVEPAAEEAAVLFYVRLFELDPDLRPLFKSNIREQGIKLMQMIGLAVNGLDRLEDLVPAVRALGVRHAEYGVEDRHYDTVAEALLWTLEKALGADFTAETKEAWTTVYTLLAETMKDAAAQHSENAAAA